MAKKTTKKKVGRPKGSKDSGKLPRGLSGEMLKISSAIDIHLVWFAGNYRLLYDQHSVPIDIKIKMLEHPQLKAAIMLSQALIANAQWEWECKEKAEIADYANRVFSPHWWDLSGIIIAAKNFGFAPCEKIFQVETWSGWGEAITFKEIKYVSPSTVNMWVDKNGRYAGFSQPSLNVDKRIKPEKTFWLTHNAKQGILKHNPYWGWADIDMGCYTFWYNNTILWQMFLRYMARKAHPILIGFAPPIIQKMKKGETWEEYNLMDYLHKIMMQIQEGSVLTLPFKETAKGNKMVDIKMLETERRVSEFIQALQATAENLLYSYLCPPAIFQKPSTTVGSYALVESHVSLFIEYLSGFILKEAIHQLEDNLIHPLVRMQYGQNAPLPKFRPSLLKEADKKMMSDQIALMIRAGELPIDAEETLRRLGCPLPIKVDPEGTPKIKGDGHERRIGGKKSPDRITE